MNDVKVSACIIVYNHEKYIRDCLEGALSQQVNGDYEIVISEDRSTDNTRQIVEEYQRKYPDKIKLFLNEKNLGLIGNWVKSMQRCQGEYLAICEGDDYWTDPYKLQKQIDFLDSNPDYCITSHNADVIKDGAFIRKYCVDSHPQIMDLEYLLEFGSGGPTCSLVFRGKVIEALPAWFSQMHSCDWTIQAMCASFGKMKYFPETMGVWRKHGTGAAFNAKLEARSLKISDTGLPAKYSLEINNAINKHFDYKYDDLIKKQNAYWYNFYINEYLRVGDRKMARKYALKIFKVICKLDLRKNSWLTKRRILRLVMLFFPAFMEKPFRNIK